MVFERMGYLADSILPGFASVYDARSKEQIHQILDMLTEFTNDSVLDSFVRCLARSEATYEVAPLIDLYERSDDENLRWSAGNTLWGSKRVKGLSPWIQEKLLGPPDGAKQMLCFAAARHLKPDECRVAVESVLPEWPGRAATALQRVGNLDSIELLRKTEVPKRPGVGWIRKAIEKAILKIEQRAAGPGQA